MAWKGRGVIDSISRRSLLIYHECGFIRRAADDRLRHLGVEGAEFYRGDG
jgi:hypothetical protein